MPVFLNYRGKNYRVKAVHCCLLGYSHPSHAELGQQFGEGFSDQIFTGKASYIKLFENVLKPYLCGGWSDNASPLTLYSNHS